MTENIFDNEQVTANSKQLEILKEHFPNCFDKSGSFQLDKFKEIIEQEDLNISQEGYSLNWLGKSYARLLANENPRTLLKPDNEHNDKPENKESQNLLIKGDNIEVLKHLKYAYTGAIKMIYIDPPYNTGSDGFVYQDDRKFTPTELAELANVTIEEAKRILSFTEKGSNSHSAWLTFMYPRLYVARQLLKEDGV
ncbi:DNA methyltransferase, partial [Bacteroides sp.]|uniref:DNA methyltransferase n=1 Tax=Bacteroides sp. TaxID=29523 RepID=UPI0025902FD2